MLVRLSRGYLLIVLRFDERYVSAHTLQQRCYQSLTKVTDNRCVVTP